MIEIPPPDVFSEDFTNDELQSAFFGATGFVWRQVDIYNADGTLWMANAPVQSGSISIDYGRDERRQFDLVLDNSTGAFTSDPTGFWYDKTIKIYRGVRRDRQGEYAGYQLGEFMIDRIDEDQFPHLVSVTGRDNTKRLLMAKFSQATAYAAGVPLEAVMSGLALNAGVTRTNFPTTGITLNNQFMYEAGVPRWEAAKALAEAHTMELFFDRFGVLTMRPFVDPTTTPVVFTFNTGTDGNLVNYSKSTNDSQIHNHILVKGANTVLAGPVAFSVENTEPSSATRIARLGRRTYVFDSKIVDTLAKAEELANALLKIMALESYELSWSSLVAPWIEVGNAVEFVDPRPSPFAPTRFLLTSVTIPLGIGEAMSAGAKRVTIVQ